MIIRKLFRFENAHVVRNCSTRRCALSLHGHSYRVELLLTASRLDNAGMILDFGLLKGAIKELIDSWDHAACFWDRDDPEYIAFIQRHSERWVSVPVNPSAEQFSRVFFALVDAVLTATEFGNGEQGVSLDSVIVHETDTGYAQCWRDDAFSPDMGGPIALDQIVFSDAIREEWSDPRLWAEVVKAVQDKTRPFRNPLPSQQVP